MDGLSALKPLRKLRMLALSGEADDPRLDWLSLGPDVMVGTWCSDIAGRLALHSCWSAETEQLHRINAVCPQCRNQSRWCRQMVAHDRKLVELLM